MGKGVGIVGSAMQPTGGQTPQPMGSNVNQFGGQNPYATQSSLMSNQMGSGMTGQATYLTNPGVSGQNQYAMTGRPDFQAMQQRYGDDFIPRGNRQPGSSFGSIFDQLRRFGQQPMQNSYASPSPQQFQQQQLQQQQQLMRQQFRFQNPYAARAQQMNMGIAKLPIQGRYGQYGGQFSGQVGYPQTMGYPQPMQPPQQEFDAGMGQVSINPMYPREGFMGIGGMRPKSSINSTPNLLSQGPGAQFSAMNFSGGSPLAFKNALNRQSQEKGFYPAQGQTTPNAMHHMIEQPYNAGNDLTNEMLSFSRNMGY